MSATSTIEWTDATWNPVRGCTKVSPGCKHCYAERFAERFRGVPGHPYEQGFDPRLVPEVLAHPLKWTKPKMVFVDSMSDLFQEWVPVDYLQKVARVMQMANWHTYQVLTKRADVMRKMLGSELGFAARQSNIWWGVSVEDKEFGLPRIDLLRQTPATMRFLSIEPLLEDLGEIDLSGIDWVIVGGDSGGRARPMERLWVLDLLRQCRSAKVPFFFKQWGGVQKGKTGRLLNGRTYDAMPQVELAAVPSRRERLKMIAEVDSWLAETFNRSGEKETLDG